MAKTAILKVRIISDGSGARAGFADATSNLDKFEAKVQSASRAAVVAGGAVVALGAKAVSAASDLQQSAGAVDAVFKGQAAAVHELGQNAATAVGLSSSAYQQTAAVLGAQLKNLGVSQADLGARTNDLIALGADLSAQFGGTTQEAVEALSAAFRGERDPIEKYGVSIKQTQIDAWMAAHGMKGLEGAAKTAGEAQATLALITEQTADAHGAFARETDTVAHQQQVAKASYENSMAAIGTGLLPVLATLAERAAVVAQAIGAHPQVFANIAIAVGIAAGAILLLNGALRAYHGVMLVIGATRAIWAGLQAAAFAYYTGTAAAAGSSAAVTLGAWVGVHLRMLALWAAQKLAALGTFIATSASAVVHAAIVAGAWVVANTRAAASFLLTRGAQLAAAAATGVVTAAQWAWNAALNANPIGLVIIAVIALVALFVVLWNKCETFRTIVTAVGHAGMIAFEWIRGKIADVIGWVVNLWNRTEGLRDVIVRAMNLALHPIDAVRAAFDTVAGAVRSVIGWISRIHFPSPPKWLHFSGAAFATAPAMLTAASTTANLSAFAVPTIDAGTVARDGGAAVEVVRNEFHISGAIDPQSVADQIRGVLEDSDRSRGSVSAARMTRSVGIRV